MLARLISYFYGPTIPAHTSEDDERPSRSPTPTERRSPSASLPPTQETPSKAKRRRRKERRTSLATTDPLESASHTPPSPPSAVGKTFFIITPPAPPDASPRKPLPVGVGLVMHTPEQSDNEAGFQVVRRRSSATARTSSSSSASSLASVSRYLPHGASPTPRAAWSEGNAAHHYQKHGRGIAKTQSPYEKLAIKLHRAPISATRPAFQDNCDAGTIYRYDVEKNLFSSAAPDGTIKTLYKPNNDSVSFTYTRRGKVHTATYPTTPGLHFKYLAAVNHFNNTNQPIFQLKGSERKSVLGQARARLDNDNDLIH